MSSALFCAPAIEAAMERATTTKMQRLLVPENNFPRWAKAVPLVFKNFTPFPRPRSQCYTSPVKRSYREFHEQWVSLNFLIVTIGVRIQTDQLGFPAEVPHVFHIMVLQILFRFGFSFGGCIDAASESPGSRTGAARHS